MDAEDRQRQALMEKLTLQARKQWQANLTMPGMSQQYYLAMRQQMQAWEARALAFSVPPSLPSASVFDYDDWQVMEDRRIKYILPTDAPMVLACFSQAHVDSLMPVVAAGFEMETGQVLPRDVWDRAFMVVRSTPTNKTTTPPPMARTMLVDKMASLFCDLLQWVMQVDAEQGVVQASTSVVWDTVGELADKYHLGVAHARNPASVVINIDPVTFVASKYYNPNNPVNYPTRIRITKGSALRGGGQETVYTDEAVPVPWQGPTEHYDHQKEVLEMWKKREDASLANFVVE